MPSNTELYQRIIGDTEGLGSQVMNMSSGFNGINNAGDVSKRFGLDTSGILKNIATKYGRQRRNLSSSLGRSRSAVASRMGSNTAIPEASFSDIEGNYANAFSNLDAAQAGEEVNQETETQRVIAQILQNALSQGDQFQLNKAGLSSRILSQRGQLTDMMAKQGEEDRKNEGSFLDDVTAGLGLGAKVLGFPTGKGGKNVLSSIMSLFG